MFAKEPSHDLAVSAKQSCASAMLIFHAFVCKVSPRFYIQHHETVYFCFRKPFCFIKTAYLPICPVKWFRSIIFVRFPGHKVYRSFGPCNCLVSSVPPGAAHQRCRIKFRAPVKHQGKGFSAAGIPANIDLFPLNIVVFQKILGQRNRFHSAH